MISVRDLSKEYHSRSTKRWIRALNGVSFQIRPGEKLAIMGQNGAGKSTLVRLISGVELPTQGHIDRDMTVSWPVGLSGGMAPTLTGNDNIRFIARLYGKPHREVLDYVEDFTELGTALSEPVSSYSTGMQARLNFALSLAIDFDCYLVDEIISVGDQRFRQRSHQELFDRRADRSLILVSHDPEIVRSYCSKVLILHHGRGKLFDDMDLAFDIYRDLR